MLGINQVGVLSVAKVMGALNALLGLIVGFFVSVLSLADVFGRDSHHFLLMFDISAVVFNPFVYGAAGFVGGMIGAALFNLAADMVGGVKIQTIKPPELVHPRA